MIRLIRRNYKLKTCRQALENKQIWIYGLSIVLGGLLGILNKPLGARLDWTIAPLIALLMYGMFTQIPFLALHKALSNFRFMAALLIGNFVAVPVIVWILITTFPQSPPILLGVCLVLLTPCIDYVIVFTRLGKGDEKLVLAATPMLFVVQMMLLPLYLWLFMGHEMMAIVHVEPFLKAFLLMIIAPLVIAICTQLWAKRQQPGQQLLSMTAWLPVPLMALVLMTVVASQIGKVYSDFEIIARVIPIYVLFLLITSIVSQAIARAFKLDKGAARALIFSVGTRNSLVVLPLAFSLPEGWATLVAAVIVTQTIVELIGELFYIKFIPKLMMKD